MPSQTTWTNLNYSTLLVGVVLGLAIYGITVYHMCSYLRSPRGAADALRLRLYIIAIFALDTLSTTIMLYLSYMIREPAVTGSKFDSWSLAAWPLTSETVILLVQGFYARRVYLFDKASGRKIAVILSAIMLACIAVIIAATLSVYQYAFDPRRQFAKYYTANHILLISGDGILTATFVALLHRSRSSFTRSDKVVNILVRYALVGTLLFGVGTTGSFLSMLLLPKITFISLAIAFPTAKIYVLSVLAFLNRRDALREHGMGMGDSTIFAMSVIQ